MKNLRSFIVELLFLRDESEESSWAVAAAAETQENVH